jgi:hypothetical protein
MSAAMAETEIAVTGGNFRFWHKADMNTVLSDVRFRE